MSMPVIPIRSGFTFCGRPSGFGPVSGLPGLFSDILSSFLYNASYGRLKRVPKRNYIHLDIDISKEDVEIWTRENSKDSLTDVSIFIKKDYALPLLDFATPELLEIRARTVPPDKHRELIRTIKSKRALINHAHYRLYHEI